TAPVRALAVSGALLPAQDPRGVLLRCRDEDEPGAPRILCRDGDLRAADAAPVRVLDEDGVDDHALRGGRDVHEADDPGVEPFEDRPGGPEELEQRGVLPRGGTAGHGGGAQCVGVAGDERLVTTVEQPGERVGMLGGSRTLVVCRRAVLRDHPQDGAGERGRRAEAHRGAEPGRGDVVATYVAGCGTGPGPAPARRRRTLPTPTRRRGRTIPTPGCRPGRGLPTPGCRLAGLPPPGCRCGGLPTPGCRCGDLPTPARPHRRTIPTPGCRHGRGLLTLARRRAQR